MALKYASSKYLDYSGALQVIGDIPLDIRNVVSAESDLITASTWYKDGTDSTTSIAYTGMLVSVATTGDVYICTNASDPTSLTSWKKLAYASDISGLSGVFTFKGVAEAVSSDLKYIAICSDISDQSIVPIGTAVDLVGDLYYGWSIEGNEFWTKSSILDSTKQQYVRSESEVVGVEYDNDRYYPVNTMPAGGNENVQLQNLKGESIFVSEDAFPIAQGTQYVIYESATSETVKEGEGIGFSYTGYQFDEITTPHTISNTHTMILANDDNSGYVYQIEDNEYASNGQIWIKLGSPVDDWIIIP